MATDGDTGLFTISGGGEPAIEDGTAGAMIAGSGVGPTIGALRRAWDGGGARAIAELRDRDTSIKPNHFVLRALRGGALAVSNAAISADSAAILAARTDLRRRRSRKVLSQSNI